ncbi:hypothetical protein BJX66DRAFT_297273 [Aspergillus keveii]|uniref:Retrovirus-related Pol polyprotein from transposon TNT 1-94-like beta-barrel domain-containing protein n=1 Tax=Aspergillus keveii TaxID=714993 RepID=A0ABR4GH24_9EURO
MLPTEQPSTLLSWIYPRKTTNTMGKIGEFSKDMKAAKKQRAAEREAQGIPKRRCWDWMIVGGTTHYAKNRSSFKTYQRVGRKFRDQIYGGELFVAGIGDIELSVRSSEKKRAPTRTVILKNVLHIPAAICNGMSINIWTEENRHLVSKASPDEAIDNQNEPWWYGKPFCGLKKLALAGNPQGESYLTDEPMMLSVYVPLGTHQEYLEGRKEV